MQNIHPQQGVEFDDVDFVEIFNLTNDNWQMTVFEHGARSR
jgi:hypothetical protein